MMKTMVFVDFQNFSINMNKYYTTEKLEKPLIEYSKLSRMLVKKVELDNAELMKTFVFGYKPVQELLQLPQYYKTYQWLTNLNKAPYIEVIEGEQVIRKRNKNTEININDPSTYITEEKGTDINIAVNMISKAYTNAYDIAILVSGDTDYVPVIKQLHNLGKIVILATLPNQNISKYKGLYDQQIVISDELLQQCKKEK